MQTKKQCFVAMSAKVGKPENIFTETLFLKQVSLLEHENFVPQ
jgi:hypothetical protein